jgi:riboflavin synthase
MFTGIVEEKGTIRRLARGGAGWMLEVSANRALVGTEIGDSVAVNGCCLTVVAAGEGCLRFDVLEETLRRTNFAELSQRVSVNLERSLRFDGKIGGHFVSGHIDGVGTVERHERRGADTYFSVRVPEGSGRYLIHKGSVAIDGVSLTIAEVDGDRFAVWLIPHTLSATTLGERAAGCAVNLEFDLLGKYVEKLIAAYRP